MILNFFFQIELNNASSLAENFPIRVENSEKTVLLFF
jgi:hypothetical protein